MVKAFLFYSFELDGAGGVFSFIKEVTIVMADAIDIVLNGHLLYLPVPAMVYVGKYILIAGIKIFLKKMF